MKTKIPKILVGLKFGSDDMHGEKVILRRTKLSAFVTSERSEDGFESCESNVKENWGGPEYEYAGSR